MVPTHRRHRGDPADGQVDAAELSRLCDEHRYDEVAERAGAGLAITLSPRDEAYAHHFLGVALHHVRRTGEAIDHLARARDLFDGLRDPWASAESLDWEATARHVAADATALALGEEALSRYRRLEPRRPEIEARMLEHVGTFLLAREAYTQAQERYEEALQVADRLRDLSRLIRVYHGLGRCAWSLGDQERALELMRRTLNLAAVEHELVPAPARVSLPAAENDCGLMLMHRGQLQRAEAFFRSALDHVAAPGLERLQSHVLLSLAELCHSQDRDDEAFVLIDRALGMAGPLNETQALASAYEQRSALHVARGEHDLACESLVRALAILETAGLHERHTACLLKYRGLTDGRQTGAM
jgi:tetratricopeptide (TPR) repeat protein